MPQNSTPTQQKISFALLSLSMVILAFISGCTAPPPAQSPTRPPTPPSVPQSGPALGPAPQVGIPGSNRISLALTSQEYRADAAGHLYGLYAQRIYQGRLPPMLEAVGVLNVDIDSKGNVKALSWLRAPKHVPEVMAEIERMVKASAPYPIPKHLKQVTYTDVWLWHKSGKFQLDTLTEGQN